MEKRNIYTNTCKNPGIHGIVNTVILYMNNRANNFAERVVKFVLSRSDDELGELTVEKISLSLNISLSHMYFSFKTRKNITPRKFLVMTKMFRSASLLQENDMLSIKSLAKKMGFSSCDYFNKIFKEHFGTTPGKFREYKKISNRADSD